MTLDEWRRLAAVPQREVEATLNTADAAGEFMERMAALRAAAAGEVTSAEGIAATQVALRRVFDRFVIHRIDAPEAPRRVDAEAMVGASYVLEPLVAEARLGTLPAGTPVVTRSPLSLEQDNSRPSRQGRNNRSGSRRGTAGGTAPRRRTSPRERARS